PRAAGAVSVPDGTAHLVSPRGDPRRKAEAAAGDPAVWRRAGHRAACGTRAVRPRREPRGPDARLPRGTGRRSGLRGRDVRCTATGDRQLALGRRSGVRAHRQAAPAAHYRGGRRVPGPTAAAAETGSTPG